MKRFPRLSATRGRHSARIHIALGIVFLTLIGCTESTISPSKPPAGAALALASLAGCGASFRMITEDVDSLMTPYGLPASIDTIDVCETWTGNDYSYQGTAVGSSDDVPPFVDSVQTTIYQNGYVTGYTQLGTPAAPATPVGSTEFASINASSALIQASYDYPYYGVSSPAPDACTSPPCPIYQRLSGDLSSVAATPQFSRHGLSRHGIRALVDGAEEIAPSQNGNRRFRSFENNATIIRSIDPKTQLLVAEESAAPADSSEATHVWTQVPGGYVREHTDIQSVEHIGGKRIRNRTTIRFQRVQITDPAFGSVVGPDVTK